jgi:hypothetical protein
MLLTPNNLLLTPNDLLLIPDEMVTTKRSAMSKQSPYSRKATVSKAGKTVQKKQHGSKTMAKSVQTKQMSPKKEKLMEARARAKAWAKRELGQKKKADISMPNAQATASAVASAKDEEGTEDHTMKESESVNKQMMNALDEVDDDNNQFILEDISEDVFFDAMDFLPSTPLVEDASSDEDEGEKETRRCSPLRYGQSWMEPIGALYSDVIGRVKPDPK